MPCTASSFESSTDGDENAEITPVMILLQFVWKILLEMFNVFLAECDSCMENVWAVQLCMNETIRRADGWVAETD